MQSISQFLTNRLSLKALVFGLILVTTWSYAEEVPVAIEAQIQPLTEAEIQQGLVDMRQKMNSGIDAWGEKLTRKDFERKRMQLVLKVDKQQEVCNIFQGVVDETYQSAQRNKYRLTEDDQKVVDNRTTFVQALGIQNNIIPTKLGFDCRVR